MADGDPVDPCAPYKKGSSKLKQNTSSKNCPPDKQMTGAKKAPQTSADKTKPSRTYQKPSQAASTPPPKKPTPTSTKIPTPTIPKLPKNLPNFQDHTKKILQVMNQHVFAKNLGAGTIAGVVTGVILSKIGKPTLFAAGSGILIYEILLHNGIVKTDWSTLMEKAAVKKGEIRPALSNHSALLRLKQLALKNKVFTAGYVGGLCLSLSF